MDLKSVVFTFLLLCCGNINTCVLGCGWCDRLWGSNNNTNKEVFNNTNKEVFAPDWEQELTAKLLESYIIKMLQSKKGIYFEAFRIENQCLLYDEKFSYLNKEKFEKIKDPYLKLLATWFLSDSDYKDYIKSCLQEHDSQQENGLRELKNVTVLFEEKNDFKALLQSSFKKSLNSDLKKNETSIKKLSEFLKECKPFDEEVYRGTGFYYSEDSSGKYVKESDLVKKLNGLFGKIKNCVWQENGLGYFSKNSAVAGFFAKHEGTVFNFIIHCRRVIDGVDVSILPEKNEENYHDPNIKALSKDKNEEEVLFPENSSFKIFGLRPKIIPYFYNGVFSSINPEKKQLQGAFIFLDVVQVPSVKKKR